MNSLTLEEQRLLTEFLGECWHEYIGPLNKARSHEELQRRYKCKNCGKEARELTPCRLDFSDWRVVGRLIEKAIASDNPWQNLKITQGSCANSCILERVAGTIIAIGKTPQLAICKAICAYLQEGEK